MKKHLLASLVFITACEQTGNSGQATGSAASPKNNNTPQRNTIVAADSIRITEDKLNDQYFAISVIATDSSVNGEYDIEAHWGFNVAVNTIQLPVGGEHFKPLLRKGNEPYSYVIGFHFDDDTVFHDYYSIQAQKGQIVMKYLKAYTFQ